MRGKWTKATISYYESLWNSYRDEELRPIDTYKSKPRKKWELSFGGERLCSIYIFRQGCYGPRLACTLLLFTGQIDESVNDYAKRLYWREYAR